MSAPTSTLSTLNELFQQEISRIEKEKKDLQDDKEQWELIKKQEQKMSFPDGEIIRLNVGGTIFMTTASTLKCTTEKYPAHYFSVMMSGIFDLCKDSEENIFIDRDPRHFHMILNFLRDNLDYKEMERIIRAQSHQREIRKELNFYNLAIIPHFNSIWSPGNVTVHKAPQKEVSLKKGDKAFIETRGNGLCSVSVKCTSFGCSQLQVGFCSTVSSRDIGGTCSCVVQHGGILKFILDPVEKKEMRVELNGHQKEAWPLDSTDTEMVKVTVQNNPTSSGGFGSASHSNTALLQLIDDSTDSGSIAASSVQDQQVEKFVFGSNDPIEDTGSSFSFGNP